MKTVYIPKGETVRYESLTTEHLVVHGCLENVDGFHIAFLLFLYSGGMCLPLFF